MSGSHTRVGRQLIDIKKVHQAIAAVDPSLNPANRFQALSQDQKRDDKSVDDQFAKAKDYSLEEIYYGIMCYRSPQKRIAALTHFQKHLSISDAACDKKRFFTRLILNGLIDNTKTISELDEIQQALLKYDKNPDDLGYFCHKRSDVYYPVNEISNQWKLILEALKARRKKLEAAAKELKAKEQHLKTLNTFIVHGSTSAKVQFEHHPKSTEKPSEQPKDEAIVADPTAYQRLM